MTSSGPTEPYALLHATGRTRLARGRLVRHRLLADVPAPGELPVVSMVPFAQLRERGYEVHDDGESILTLVCSSLEDVDDAELQRSADTPGLRLGEVRLTMSDEEYAHLVEEVIEKEIRHGEGANFLLSRQARIQAEEVTDEQVRGLFARLVTAEPNAYLVFCFFDGERYFLGASPERHLTLQDGEVTMTPISGTLTKAALRSRADLVEFITDPKEINELFQVVDEELKMMSRICEQGGAVVGPQLIEMASVVHTAYDLRGHTTSAAIDAFRSSMFAATMVGSPLENAARVIHRYEPASRRYYSSAIMIQEVGPSGSQDLDSAITIRMMEITPEGEVILQSGGTVVRDSEPTKETREAVAKMKGMLDILDGRPAPEPVLDRFLDEPARELLQARNRFLSRFWVADQSAAPHGPADAPLDVLVIDHEDDFTHMLVHALRSLGHRVTWRRYNEQELPLTGWDVVVAGPGPGDPADQTSEKMAAVRATIRELLQSQTPFLAVCLSHQVLSMELGLKVEVLDPPLQGVQQSIDYFGRQEAVGFYNTFCPVLADVPPSGVSVATAPDGRSVMALRGPHFASFQFHLESVLTSNSIPILREALGWLAPQR